MHFFRLFFQQIFSLALRNLFFTITIVAKTKKGEIIMKKLLLALFAVLTLASCGGYYKSGNCEYEFLFHKDISISKLINSCGK